MARTEASDSLAGAGKGWRVGGSRAGWSTFSPGSWPQSDRLLAARKLLRALTARDDGRTVRIVFLQSNFYGYSTIIGVSQPLNCLRNGRISSLCLGAFAKCCRLGLSVKMSGAIVVLVVLVIIYHITRCCCCFLSAQAGALINCLINLNLQLAHSFLGKLAD